MKTSDISIQLYTARKFEPYDDVLSFFSNSGIKNIELFGIENFNINEISNLLKKNNLKARSTHVSFSALENIELIIEKLKVLNIKHAIVPAPQEIPGKDFKSFFEKNEDEWNQFGIELSSYVKIFEENGITLGYHNHSFEFIELPSGKMPIECMLDHNENLKFEIDIGWATAAKVDPIFWIKKYSKKIISCHLKDFFSKNHDLLNHNSQSSVGEGFIDWKKIFEELKKSNCELFILEHDDPKDLKDYTLKSLNYLKNVN